MVANKFGTLFCSNWRPKWPKKYQNCIQVAWSYIGAIVGTYFTYFRPPGHLEREKNWPKKDQKNIFFSIFGPWRAQKYTFTPKIICYQKLEVQTLLLREKKGKNFWGSFEIFWFLSKTLSEHSECSQSILGSKTAFKTSALSAWTFWCIISLCFLLKKIQNSKFCILAKGVQKSL